MSIHSSLPACATPYRERVTHKKFGTSRVRRRLFKTCLGDPHLPGHLVEEHVDLDGLQFPESILELWYFAHASQQNVVTLEFGSPCPRSALFARDSRDDQQRIFPFPHEVFHLQR